MRSPFGIRGGVIDIPFLMWMQRISLVERQFCQSRGVQMPVVPGVVRRLVMRFARYGQPDRVLSVVPCKARCASCGTMLVWSAHAGGNRANSTGVPNKPLQPTASRARS